MALAALLALGSGRAPAPPPEGSAAHVAATDTRVAANDNRRPGGRLDHDTLRIRLEARAGQWQPEGDKGRSLDVDAWAEAGATDAESGAAHSRAPGTEVRASSAIRSTKPLTVYGFGATRGTTDSVTIAPGASREVGFTATTPGTYYYAGKTWPGPLPGAAGRGQPAQRRDRGRSGRRARSVTTASS